MPTVSVITPTYNRADVLGRAIESVQRQTFRDFEHVVVDDGSTDGTEQLVSGYDGDSIRYVRLDGNEGVATAQNRGLEAASGEYVSFLDSDDEYLPERLETTVAALDDAPDRVGGVCTAVEVVEDRGENYVESVPAGEFGLAELADEYCVNASTSTMFRSSVFDRVGTFDEELRSTIDYDLHLRIAREYDLLGIDRVLSRKYEDVDGIRDDHEKVRQGEGRFLEKHGDVLTDRNRSMRQFKIGRANLRLGDLEAAREHFEKCLDAPLDPERGSRRQYWIGKEWLERGDEEAARRHFAGSLDPSLTDRECSYRHYLVGKAWLERGEKAPARRHLTAAVRRSPTNYRAVALVLASLLPVDGARSTAALRGVERWVP